MIFQIPTYYLFKLINIKRSCEVVKDKEHVYTFVLLLAFYLKFN